MAKEIKYLSKTNEKLDKALTLVEQQVNRSSASVSDLADLDAKIEQAKADMRSLSFDQQESKLDEIDKLLTKRAAVKMRVDLLSGPNNQIIEELKEVGKAYNSENAELVKLENEFESNFKKFEKEYEDACELNRQKIDQLRNARYDIKVQTNRLLRNSGLSNAEVKHFCQENKIPFDVKQMDGYKL